MIALEQGARRQAAAVRQVRQNLVLLEVSPVVGAVFATTEEQGGALILDIGKYRRGEAIPNDKSFPMKQNTPHCRAPMRRRPPICLS